MKMAKARLFLILLDTVYIISILFINRSLNIHSQFESVYNNKILTLFEKLLASWPRFTPFLYRVIAFCHRIPYVLNMH